MEDVSSSAPHAGQRSVATCVTSCIQRHAVLIVFLGLFLLGIVVLRLWIGPAHSERAEAPSQRLVEGSAGFSPLSETYAELIAGYSLRIPQGWQVSVWEVPGVKAKVLHGKPTNGFAPNIILGEEQFTGTLSDYSDTNLKNMRSALPALRNIRPSDFKTDSGLSGKKVVFEKEQGGRRLRQTFYFLDGLARNKVVITCSVLADDFAKLEPTFEASVRSFKVRASAETEPRALSSAADKAAVNGLTLEKRLRLDGNELVRCLYGSWAAAEEHENLVTYEPNGRLIMSNIMFPATVWQWKTISAKDGVLVVELSFGNLGAPPRETKFIFPDASTAVEIGKDGTLGEHKPLKKLDHGGEERFDTLVRWQNEYLKKPK